MSCNHSQETAYIACVDCDIEHATLAERERIIKLLDVIEYPNGNETKFQMLVNTVFEGEMLFRDFRRELIALIKGENK